MAGEQQYRIKNSAIDRCIAEGNKVAVTLATEGWALIEEALNTREKYLSDRVANLADKVGPNSNEELRLAALELKQFRIVRLFPKQFIDDRRKALLQQAQSQGKEGSPLTDGEDK